MRINGLLKKIVTGFGRNLFLIPFFFTFANAILGLLSVFKTLNSEYAVAAYCILLAAFMDGLDGRLARALNSCTVLGMELDSLSDAISFCVAPVVLLYSWELQDFGTLGFIVLAVYLCAGLFRLAKFNIISKDQSNFFLGLPTPIAAFFLTNIVLYHDWISQNKVAHLLLEKNVLFVFVVLISFLMVSKIKFPTFKNKSSRVAILPFLIIGLLCILLRYPFFLLIPFLYILSGFTKGCYFRAKQILASRF